MNESYEVFGIDFAVSPKNRGLAKLSISNSQVFKLELFSNSRLSDEFILLKIDECKSDNIIVCIDSPLGWPVNMITRLSKHNAGEKVSDKKRSNFFKRRTELLISNLPGVNALAIGAEKIAYTAFEALNFIDKLPDKFKINTGYLSHKHNSVIEVYPGAMLSSLLESKVPYKGYKYMGKNSAKIEKARLMQVNICDAILSKYNLEVKIPSPKFVEHDLDAILCALTGYDYFRDLLVEPQDLKLSKSEIIREGWIWELRK